MSLSKVEGEPTLRRRRRDRGFHHKRALAVNSRCLAREAREKTPKTTHRLRQRAMLVAAVRGQHVADGTPSTTEQEWEKECLPCLIVMRRIDGPDWFATRNCEAKTRQNPDKKIQTAAVLSSGTSGVGQIYLLTKLVSVADKLLLYLL